MDPMAARLTRHIEAHPKMELQDGIKFLYQAHLGCGHLITDEAAVQSRLIDEWNAVPEENSGVLYEELSDSWGRLYLSVCKGIGLSVRTVERIFLLSAQEEADPLSALDNDLELLQILPAPIEKIDKAIQSYRDAGLPPVHHSQPYRQSYHPHYRVISRRFFLYLPLFASIDRLMRSGEPIRIGVDGPCASGKTTLGETLQQVYSCPLIHMDDFFLPAELRTPQRLAQPGGNVDYERFDREVLSPLTAGKAAVYRPFRCHTMSFGSQLRVEPSPLTVVEGSYALRPDLRDRYQLRVWVEADWEVRRRRLLDRGGEACLSTFLTRWIPMEDLYFSTYQVRNCCQQIVSGNP